MENKDVSSDWMVLVSTSTVPMETSGHIVLAQFATLNILIDINSCIMSKKSLCSLVIRSVFPLCEVIAWECSESPIPRCTSLIISIWRSLSLITNLFL